MPTVTVPGSERTLRTEPLWARVDRNRARIATFVVAYIGGSAALLTVALVLVPGVLLGLGADLIEAVPFDDWFGALPWVVAAAFAGMLAIGAVIAAVQLANARDWVRNRFEGRDVAPGEYPALEAAVTDMALAAGLAEPPELLVLATDSVNACAIGTTRARPTIGVTRGMLAALSDDEIRAVVATLTARIVAGDILFGTALAALMGPIKAVRASRAAAAQAGGCALEGCVNGCGDPGCGNLSGCADAGSGCGDLGDLDEGCAGAIGIVVFLALVAAITYAAVVTAAWIVTVWGRLLHRASYEKADAEGMLLLKDPAPMLAALGKVIAADTLIAEGDASYDSIFYVPTSGTTRIEPDERERFQRLREVLGVEGAAADLDGAGPASQD